MDPALADTQAVEARPAEARSEDTRLQNDWALERAVKRREWYGGWVLGTDALAGTLLVGSLAVYGFDDRMGGVLLLSAATTYVFGASIAHVAHGRPLSAVKSVGLRLGAPVVGALMGFGGFFAWRQLDGSTRESDRVASDGAKAFICLALTVPTSIAAASLLDAAALSWAPPHFGPTLEVARGGATLGVRGAL
ncbi:MAG: hypothetical protein JNL38_35490 [Myxococcales bacterium]|nr:hypothetical protein [Myxococcales bacterium]